MFTDLTACNFFLLKNKVCVPFLPQDLDHYSSNENNSMIELMSCHTVETDRIKRKNVFKLNMITNILLFTITLFIDFYYNKYDNPRKAYIIIPR